MELPVFVYHPDPLASGSIAVSDATCACCGRGQGLIYTGPVYAQDDLNDALCPWCIADGSAHEKFDASFADAAQLPAGLPPEVVDEIAHRTPGFSTWQQEQWLGCCNDAAAFVEPVGHTQLQSRYPRLEGTLITYIVQQMGITGGAANKLYRSLNRDRGPTAYIFQCRHCDNQPAYIDTP